MRKILVCTALALATLAGAAHAGTAAEPYVKKLNPAVPGATSAGTIQSDLLAGMGEASSPAVTAGMPMVPASDPNAAAASVAPVASAPAAAAPQGPAALPASAMPGVQPGVPVPVYTTMAQAAAAGVDPLGERAPVQASAAAAEAPSPEVAVFDVTNPASWLPWLQANQDAALRYGGLALLGVAVGMLMARRRAAPEA